LFDLQRATTARVHHFRHVPMKSWFPAYRDPAAAPLFSTRTQESFYRAQLTVQIALRAHQQLDLIAFRSASGSEVEGHITYPPGLYSLLTFGGRYIEEWVSVFYATVWIDPDHQRMRFCFERENVTIHTTQIRELFCFLESNSLCYGTSDPPSRLVAPSTIHVTALLRSPFTDGSRRSLANFTTAAKFLYELMRSTLLP
jgi:hypothetical protein